MSHLRLILLGFATLATLQMPAPTGTNPIGTTTWHLTDDARDESFDPGTRRQVEVHVWYPAAAGRGTRAPYLREGMAEAQRFSTMLRGGESGLDHLAGIETHADVDAAPIARPAKLPLLVFSHGYGGPTSAYTALLEDLASRGYIVMSIVHPYESVAATLADGTVVSLIDASGKPRPGYLAVVSEWAKEDDTMAAVSKSSNDDEQRRLLREYFAGLQHTTDALRRWVADTKFVLDRVTSARSGPMARIGGRIDPTRVGAFGHSMGGVTAGQFCLEDARCKAGLNLDGIPQSGTMIDARLGKPFLMTYSARPGRLGASDVIYRRAASTYYRVDVADTRHLDFSDMIFWAGPLSDRGALGAIAPDQAVLATRTIVREYFDQVLLGRASPLLAKRATLPEVTVR